MLKRIAALLLALCLLCCAALAETLTCEDAIAYARTLAAAPGVEMNISFANQWDVFVDEDDQTCYVTACENDEYVLEVAVLPDGELRAMQFEGFWLVDYDSFTTEQMAELLPGDRPAEIAEWCRQWIETYCPAMLPEIGAWMIPCVMEAQGAVYCYVALAGSEESLTDPENDLAAMMVVVQENDNLRVLVFNRNYGPLASYG